MLERLKNKINYWLEKKMASGAFSMIKMLAIFTFIVVVVIAVIITVSGIGNSDSFLYSFWDLLATAINAWMPSSEDGSAGYIILNALTAIIGLFFTSVLIGIISSSIEEKLNDLRKGNSIILEEGHTVILGYNLGEHFLLKQLILHTGSKKRVFVICTNNDKEEMENDLRSGLDIPQNITIICRNCDITSVSDLRNCSIEQSKAVIINAIGESYRIKSILAVASLLKEYPDNSRPSISAVVSEDKYMISEEVMKENNIHMFQLDDVLSKIIARSATESGIAEVYKELFNYEDSELYVESISQLEGLSMLEAVASIDKAVVIAVERNGTLVLNPDKNLRIGKDDKLVLFEESKNAYVFERTDKKNIFDKEAQTIIPDKKQNLVFLGYNEMLEEIIDELDEEIGNIVLANVSGHEEEIEKLSNSCTRFEISVSDADVFKLAEMNELVKDADSVIVLSDRTKEYEDADTDNILLIMKLKELKKKHNYVYNITSEFMMDGSTRLLPKDSDVDFVIGANIAAMIVAQMAESPELKGVFTEILSREGNNLISIDVEQVNLALDKGYKVTTLKQILLTYGYTFIGYKVSGSININPRNNERVSFSKRDKIIALGKEL